MAVTFLTNEDESRIIEAAKNSEKTYEHLATITVAPDAEGNLPQHVIFTTDKEGNPLSVTDFIIRANATFVDYSKSTLYIAANLGEYIFVNSKVSGMTAEIKPFTVFVRREPDGCIRAEHTDVTNPNVFYDPSAAIKGSQLIAPMSGLPFNTFTKIDLFTLLGDTKAWADGSTFELWGVRA